MLKLEFMMILMYLANGCEGVGHEGRYWCTTAAKKFPGSRRLTRGYVVLDKSLFLINRRSKGFGCAQLHAKTFRGREVLNGGFSPRCLQLLLYCLWPPPVPHL